MAEQVPQFWGGVVGEEQLLANWQFDAQVEMEAEELNRALNFAANRKNSLKSQISTGF